MEASQSELTSGDASRTLAPSSRSALEAACHGVGPGLSAGDGCTVSFREAIEAARHRASLEYLVALMRRFHGNVTWAARGARLQRISLHRLLRRYGIRPEDFRLDR